MFLKVRGLQRENERLRELLSMLMVQADVMTSFISDELDKEKHDEKSNIFDPPPRAS